MESSCSQAGVPRRKGKDEATKVLLSVREIGYLQNSIRVQGWLNIRGVESASVRPRAHIDSIVPSWVLLPQPCQWRTASRSSGRWDWQGLVLSEPTCGLQVPRWSWRAQRQGVSEGPPSNEMMELTPGAVGSGIGETTH